MMTLAEAHALLPSSELVGDGATPIARVHSDTRSLRAGDLFVALRGERFDAHDFLPAARAAGAAAVLAERGLGGAAAATRPAGPVGRPDAAGAADVPGDPTGPAGARLPGLRVADSRIALGDLAAGWRARFAWPLIAVTGSNGKTTVTQMIASVLRAWLGDAGLATAGNFNNEIGVPLTLLRLRPDHRAAVVELGMNHAGEIARLAALAAPTIAVVNNAQREHLEFMASVDAVARENGAVIAALPADGCAVLPAGDAFLPLWQGLAAGRRVLTFAQRTARATAGDDEPDVLVAGRWNSNHWQVELTTPAGRCQLRLQAPGTHNLHNAAAAAACALAAGCPLDAISRGLDGFAPVAGRSQVKPLPPRGGHGGATLIDDSYNANPDSVRAAIDLLAGLPAPRWLVLGDMGEVGDQGAAFHREVGLYAAQRGVDALWTAGPLSTHAAAAFAGARHFEEVIELLGALSATPAFASVLVKGSRFMRMERVAAALLGEGESGAH